MTTAETKAAWKAAHAELAAIDAERSALVAHTEERYQAAKERLEAIEDEHGDPIICEGCQAPIFDDDPYLGGETPLCQECAPTYEHMVKDPEGFVDSDGNPLTFAAALRRYNLHLATGGEPSDSMATVQP